ncbi:MAG: D-alanine--D-alanine ligase [Magnetococcales bacterium]|nr:D-alanine--D-alanine ligase [Magnetococcales bacterium]
MAVDKTKKIGVLLGGSSTERAVSLRSGAALLAAYQRLGWSVVAIDTQFGRELPAQLLAHGIEVAVIALHGPMGEDGSVQGLLEVMEIPYTGSGVTASALCMNKLISKRFFQQMGIATPAWEEVRLAPGDPDALSRMVADLTPRWQDKSFFVKPASAGSSVGIRRVGQIEELAAALTAAAAAAAQPGEAAEILLEQEIVGAEVTLSILDGTPLPLIEICPVEGFYDYLNKYTPGKTRYLVPTESLSVQDIQGATDTGLAASQRMGCRGLHRVDMIVDRAGCAWVLEINTIPGLTETSLAPKAAAAAGLTFDALAERILAGATRDLSCANKLPHSF